MELGAKPSQDGKENCEEKRAHEAKRRLLERDPSMERSNDRPLPEPMDGMQLRKEKWRHKK